MIKKIALIKKRVITNGPRDKVPKNLFTGSDVLATTR